MNQRLESVREITRRHFFGQCSVGIGSIALASLFQEELVGEELPDRDSLARSAPHFAPRARSIIYLHMAGSPPQHELFDYKPTLVEHNDKPCPKEFLKGERFAFIKGTPKLLGTPYKFSRQGQCGTMISELLPHLSRMIDDVAVVKSMRTDFFNHAPAQMFLYTGTPRFGNPSMGSWLTYGLGSANRNLPGFVVLVSGGRHRVRVRASGAAVSCPRSIRECSAAPPATRCSTSATRKA